MEWNGMECGAVWCHGIENRSLSIKTDWNIYEVKPKWSRCCGHVGSKRCIRRCCAELQMCKLPVPCCSVENAPPQLKLYQSDRSVLSLPLLNYHASAPSPRGGFVTYLCMCIFVYVCMCACVYVRVCGYVRVYLRVCVYVRDCACVCVCVYVRMYVYVRVCACVYVYEY